MSMAADLRKPRVIMSHPEVQKDYAKFHHASARRHRHRRMLLVAYVFLIMQATMVVGAISGVVWLGQKYGRTNHAHEVMQ